MLRRVSAVFFVLAASSSTEGIRAVEAEVAPLLAAHADAIRLDPALFARIEAVAEEWGVGGVATAAAAGNGAAGGDGAVVENGTADGEGAAGGGGAADTEDRRLVERYHRDAVRAGARLGQAEQERLRAINAELSSLTTRVRQPAARGRRGRRRARHRPRQLDGLTPDALSAAARAARSRGLDGHLLTLVLPTEQPALAALTHRDLRERLHTASVTRGLGGEHDTRATLLKIVTLRAERARLLGHPHHASWVVETATAASTEAVDAMLHRLAPIAAANARAEADDLAASAGHPIAPWDRAFHAERVRRERFAVDAAALRPYLELERVLHDGVFHAAHRALRPQLRRAPRPAELPPRRPRLRRLRRRRHPSACSSPTSTPATRSAAAPG